MQGVQFGWRGLPLALGAPRMHTTLPGLKVSNTVTAVGTSAFLKPTRTHSRRWPARGIADQALTLEPEWGYTLGGPRTWRAELSEVENWEDAPWRVET